MCLCVSVCLPPRLLIISGMMWCDIDPIQLVEYCNDCFVHGMNISRMTILVNIGDFIFTNLLAS